MSEYYELEWKTVCFGRGKKTTYVIQHIGGTNYLYKNGGLIGNFSKLIDAQEFAQKLDTERQKQEDKEIYENY